RAPGEAPRRRYSDDVDAWRLEVRLSAQRNAIHAGSPGPLRLRPVERLLMRRLAVRIAFAAPALATIVLLLDPPPAGAVFGCGINPWCMVTKGAGGVVSSVAGDAITAL